MRLPADPLLICSHRQTFQLSLASESGIMNTFKYGVIYRRMKYDARKLSTDEQGLLRRLAAQRVLDGESPAAVTRSYSLGGIRPFSNG